MHAARSNDARRLPDEWTRHVVAQAYERYTPDEHELWRDLVADTQRTLARYAYAIHPAYLEGFQRLIAPWKSIPRLCDIDTILEPFGWSTVSVDGYIPAAVYAGLMANGVFPVSRNLRPRNHLGFSPIPDMAHDLFGHVPMLISADHRRFLRRLAHAMAIAPSSRWDHELFEANRAMAALRCRDFASSDPALRAAETRVADVQSRLASAPSILTELSRMYLWSTEFGLMGTLSEPRIYGAGLLSSLAEIELVCSGKVIVRRYDLDVVRHDITFSDPQTRYFVARDYAELHDVLTRYEEKRPC